MVTMFAWEPELSCCICGPAHLTDTAVIELANAIAPKCSNGPWRGVVRTSPCNQIVNRKHWIIEP